LVFLYLFVFSILWPAARHIGHRWRHCWRQQLRPIVFCCFQRVNCSDCWSFCIDQIHCGP